MEIGLCRVSFAGRTVEALTVEVVGVGLTEVSRKRRTRLNSPRTR